VFDIGLSELMVIAFVAVLFVGPERLPDLARQAGRLMRQAKLLATGARDELRNELGPGYSDLELRDLDPRRIVRQHVLEAMREAEREAADEEAATLSARAALAAGERPPFDLEAT
jgi:sec-independent protein translocase protein TatB